MFKAEGAMAAPAERKPSSANFADIIRRAEEKLQLMGPGPHPPDKQQVYDKLVALIQKTKAAQLQTQSASAKHEPPSDSQADLLSNPNSNDVIGSSPPNVLYTSAASQSQPSVLSSDSTQYSSNSVSAGGSYRSTSANLVGDSSNGSIVWPQLNVPAFESRSFEQLIRETDAQLQLEDELEDAFVQLADDFVEQTVEYAIRIAKHRGSNMIEAQDMLLALERYSGQPGSSLPQIGITPAVSKRRPDSEAHRQRLALINKKFKKF